MNKIIKLIIPLYFILTNHLQAQTFNCDSINLKIDTITGLFLYNNTIPVVAKLSVCEQNGAWGHLELFKDSINGPKVRDYLDSLEINNVKIEVSDNFIYLTETFNGIGRYAVYNDYITYYKYFSEINDWCNYGSLYKSYMWQINESDEISLGPGALNHGLFGKMLDIDVSKDEHLIKKYQDLLNKNYKIYKAESEKHNFNFLNHYDQYESLDYINFIDLNDENFKMLTNIGIFLCKAGKLEEGITLFDLLNNKTDKKSNQLLLNQNIGNTYWDSGEHEKALNYYKQYLELSDSLGKNENYLQILKRKSDIENIINQIDSCIENLKINKEDWCFYSGSILVEVSSIDDCLELKSTNVSQYNNLAFYLQQLGESGTGYSVTMLQKIIDKFPNRAVAYINLGDAYWSSGKLEKAKEAYRKYIKLMEALGKENKIPKLVLTRVK
jgi:tetratricopeptide (TPR) repeat protein